MASRTIERSSASWLASALVLAAGCDVEIPEGKFACVSDANCPSAWMCIDKRCYSKRPGGNGSEGDDTDAPGMDAATPDGQTPGDDGVNPDAGADFDAGIDTTGCDAFTTFYRDVDGDGLGDMTDSISACSVATGYVTNGDDCGDACAACTKPDAAEVCDGFDNDCNGNTDEGALELAQPTQFSELPKGQWAELVTTAQGGVLFSVVQPVGASAEIRGQRIGSDGSRLGNAVTIAGAVPAIGVVAADHLKGKVVLAYLESDGAKATVLDANVFSVLVAETPVGSSTPDTFIVDVAISTSASGGRVMIAYDGSDRIRVKGLRLSNLALDTVERAVFTLPADTNAFWHAATLVAAPCLSRYYIAVLDLADNQLSVIPLGDDGQVSGTTYQPTIATGQLVTGHPALRVEGGDCNTAPTRLVLGYSTGKSLLSYTDAHLALELLDITRASGNDSFTKNGGASFSQTGWVLPAVRAYPSSAVFANRAVDVIAYQGGYLFGAMAASASADAGSVKVYEIAGGAVRASHESPTTPVLPLNFQLGLIGGKPYLGAASWSDDGDASLIRLGCGG